MNLGEKDLLGACSVRQWGEMPAAALEFLVQTPNARAGRFSSGKWMSKRWTRSRHGISTTG